MVGEMPSKQVGGGCFAALSSCFKRKAKAPSTKGACEPSVPSPTTTLTNTAASDELIESQNSKTGAPDLWSRAYQKLDEPTKKWIREISKKENGEERTEELIALARTREEEYKDGTPKLKVGDHEIVWRDYANTVVMWMTTIGDIAMNFAPAPSSVVWSAIKVLLKTNVSQCEELVAMFGCAEKVLSPIRRGRVYEIVYLHDAPCTPATEGLQDALVDLYKALVELLAHAIKRLNEGQGKQFLSALICAGKGAKLVSALSGHEHKVDMAAQACGAVALQEHQKLLQSLNEPLRQIDDNVKQLLEEIRDGTLEAALDYISPIQVGKHHLEKKEARTPTTCEWLLRDSRFLKWEGSSLSSTLWLQGNIGAGKSFLTSKVIDGLSEKKVKNGEGFAYFYCSRSDPARRDPESILQSYIRHLARVPQHPTMMQKNVYNMYRKAKEEQRGFSRTECKTALFELVNFYPRTTLILDALDECEMEAREILVDILRNLAEEAERPVKVFIASRKEDDIGRYLGSQNLVEIGTADNKDDIEKYIEVEMGKFGRAWRSVSDEVKEKVKRTIGEQSDGMFRWAYLQWEQLKNFKTNESILERLGKLPKSLTQTYDEIYFKNEGYEAVILQRAVKWVLCAREPLESEVLLWAIRLESQQNGEAEEALTLSSAIDESTLEAICSHLVIIDSQLKVWKFPHASVAEYFEVRHRDWIEKAHEDVAILLISCLIDCYSKWTPPESEEDAERFLDDTPDLHNHLDPRHLLQRYTRKYWVQHVRGTSKQCEEAVGVSQVLKRFLGAEGPQQSSSQQYQAWCRHMGIRSDLYYRELDNVSELQPAEKSIFGICAFGFHELLKHWWDKEINISQVNEDGLDLLAIAARYGHHELCSELIDLGADVNRSLDSYSRGALGEAIGKSHTKTAMLLLARGCNPNLIGKRDTALCLAVRLSESLVEILLKKGADPNIQCLDCAFGCALAAAACKNGVHSAKLLIEYGANVNLAIERGWFGSPLAAAAIGCSLECVKLLVEHNANVNARLEYGWYGSVLAAALFGHGGIDIVKYLIEEAGADTALLSSSPPPRPYRFNSPEKRRQIAKYLVEGGHVKRQVLLDIGFESDEVPSEE